MKHTGILKKIAFRTILLIVFASVLSAIYWFLGGCPIWMLLGIPCPTCGITRSALALLSLDFRLSWYYHPLTIPIFLVLTFALCKDLLPIKKHAADRILIASAAFIFVIYLIRLWLNVIS